MSKSLSLEVVILISQREIVSVQIALLITLWVLDKLESMNLKKLNLEGHIFAEMIAIFKCKQDNCNFQNWLEETNTQFSFKCINSDINNVSTFFEYFLYFQNIQMKSYKEK